MPAILVAFPENRPAQGVLIEPYSVGATSYPLRVNLAELLDTLTAEHVHVAFIPTPRPGAWYHRERLIVIDSGLTPVTQKCVLAHELVHVVRGDKGAQHPGVERLVDREAARLLIPCAEYALAERVYGPNRYRLAEELHVTQHTISAYQSLLAEC